MSDEAEIHDTSRIDAFMAARRRSMLMHAVWRPMLAGAAGAAIMAAAVIGAVWVVLPKISVREVVVDHVVPNDVSVDHVVPKDVTVDHVVPKDVPVDRVVPHDTPVDHVVPKDVSVPNIVLVPHDVPVDHVVPHDVQIDIPRIVATAPAALATPTETPAAPMGGPTEMETSTAAPRSPEERAFIDTEEWRDAVIRGRILRSDKNGFVVSTDTGDWGFWPARLNPAGKLERNPLLKDQVENLIGELTRCNRMPNGTYRCVALSQGRELIIPEVPIAAKQGRPA